MDIAPSLIKPKLTAHDLDLILDLGKHAEVVGENENVPAVFERCQQVERSFEVETDSVRRLPRWWLHA